MGSSSTTEDDLQRTIYDERQRMEPAHALARAVKRYAPEATPSGNWPMMVEGPGREWVRAADMDRLVFEILQLLAPAREVRP